MLIIFSEIPMFAILTKMDKCTLSKNEEEEMKIQICKSINIAANFYYVVITDLIKGQQRRQISVY